MLFTKEKIGPITIRNRSIRSAAFEGMCPNGIPSKSLEKYHSSVAAGGIGMTTVAYASVLNNGRTFDHQMWMRDEIIPELKKITHAVHNEGAAASIQLGHGGNMGDRKVTGERAIGPSGRLNLFGLTLPKKMTENDISDVIQAYARSVKIAMDSGFDAVEIHAGHGYLISQFLSPHTNKRKDKWGGSFENRTRFLKEIMCEVKKVASGKIAIIVKTNIEDGFASGMGKEEGLKVAKLLEDNGADALMLSGGFVSKTPFFMMKGKNPHKELIKAQKDPIIKLGMLLFSRIILKNYPYEEAYFLKDAMEFRKSLKLPLIYVGGLVTNKKIEEVLSAGFDFVAIARALVAEPDFINKLRKEEDHVSPCLRCGPDNSCVAAMYMGEMQCPFLLKG